MHRFRQGSGLQAVSSGQQKGHLGVPFFVAVLGSAIELLQVFRLAEHHHLALGPDVLEGAGAARLNTHSRLPRPKAEVASRIRAWVTRMLLPSVLDAQAPGPHADGLAGADPEPGVETADDEGQPGAVEGLVSSQAASLPSGTVAMPVASSRWATPMPMKPAMISRAITTR
jgi:hypothetical protein